jgi:serine/threonine protein kinase
MSYNSVFSGLENITDVSMTDASSPPDLDIMFDVDNGDVKIDVTGNCFVNTWDDEHELTQTTTYHVVTEMMLNPLQEFNVTEFKIDGTPSGFAVQHLVTEKTFTFKLGNLLGKGSFGEVIELLYYNTELHIYVDIGLVVKYITKPSEHELEMKILNNMRQRNCDNCCLIRQRHFMGQYFIMKKVDGDLNDFFKKYYASLLKPSFFFQKFSLLIIDRLKSLFGCINDNGYRYFDIKLDNVGYRIVRTEDGPKIELSILDIGSAAVEDNTIKSIGSLITTYTPPEWYSYNMRILSAIQLSANNKSVSEDGKRSLIRKGYVWYLCRMLYDIFQYHPEHKKRVLDTKDNDFRCEYEEDLETSKVIRIMKKMFPVYVFPKIYTGLMPYPTLRDLDLNESWLNP